MPIGHITPEEVISEANLVAKLAMDRLTRGEQQLHELGFHAYSTAMGNMRVKIETALGELVDEVMPNG